MMAIPKAGGQQRHTGPGNVVGTTVASGVNGVMSVACPACGAEKYKRCGVYRGQGENRWWVRYTAHPHPARAAAARAAGKILFGRKPREK